jgi:3-hydroxyisobutyrate dehydrogenase
MSQRIAFIGLGIMGLPMAGHLLSAGHQLTISTRTKSKAQSLLDRGATWAATPKDAAKPADVVFTCLPDTPDVREVLLGDHGVIRSAHRGQVIVDHSTISPKATREMAAALAEKGAALLDAPVSGGDVGAKNATLAIMVGGDKAAFDKALPLLQAMGKTITHTGPVGSGQLTKLTNQILVTVTNMAVSEALNFARESGLDTEKTIQAVAGGAAGSWQLSNLGPRMLKGDFAPGFMIDLQQKDLRLVLESAAELHLPLRAVQLVHELLTLAQNKGWGREGTQALFKTIKAQHG